MPQVELKAGVKFDVLSKGELDSSLMHYFAARETARLRGLKYMRLPEYLSGKASSSAISLGIERGQKPVGPGEGYAWTFRRLLVNGLTSGASPDVVNLYRGSSGTQPLWQFNGNSFAYTFGKGDIVLLGGETLALASVGTFSATGQVTLSGELIEVPAELLGKLL